MRTWIKICGTTTLADALAAVRAGADALGFIFAPSPRRVTAEQAREITRHLPGNIERVGVFASTAASVMRSTVVQAGLTAVQLHGQESPSFVGSLFPGAKKDRSMRVIKSILVREGFEKQLDQFCDSSSVDSILLDSGAGSGRVFDWETVQPKLAGYKTRFIIAGGLTPENVGQAIATFSPWGVDVVSGVEQRPGSKDHEKLNAFVAAVRKAERL